MPAVIGSLPRFLQRASDKRQAAQLLEDALQPYLGDASTRVAAQVAMGRMWLVAGDAERALKLARQAQAEDPASSAAVLLALELMPTRPEAEVLVAQYLKSPDADPTLRRAYAGTLVTMQRYADAIVQLELVTQQQPDVAAPWLTLGALQLELRQTQAAEQSLQRFVQLLQDQPAAARAADSDDDDDESGAAVATDQGLTQAWLLLAQAAEQRGDFATAEARLARVDNPQRALEVQTRRASLLARQGRVPQARELVRSAPERNPGDARAKLLAEAQVLREVKQWAEAYAVLDAANQRFPDDADLLYEQAMMAEKIDQLDAMEAQLRRVMALKPDHAHAYNALGYSLADRNLRLAEAKALIERALQLTPGDPFITDSLGWVEFRLGNRDEALRLLRQAYKARPDAEIGAHLGEVLWAMGQQDEARRIWAEAGSRDAGNDVLRETLVRLKAAVGVRARHAAGGAGLGRLRHAAAASSRGTISGRLALQVDASQDRTGAVAQRRLRLARQRRARRAAAEHAAGHDAGGRLAGRPGEARLVTPQGERRFDDLDALSRDVLGESLPLRALPDWLRGRPWPGAEQPARPLQPGPGFAQLGWTIDLARFDAGRVAGLACRSASGAAAGPARPCAMSVAAFFDVPAPAKLNLFLHVVGRRADGYHLLQSVFVLIDWCDTLALRAAQRRPPGAPRPRARRCPPTICACAPRARCSSSPAPRSAPTSRSTSSCPGAPAWAAAVPTRPPRCWR